MDSSRVDRLTISLATHTSRRTGLGLLAAVGLLTRDGRSDDVAAKRRKKRKKRRKPRQDNGVCLLLQEVCSPDATPRCCDGLRCDLTGGGTEAGAHCCQPEGAPCTAFEPCCSRTCDSLVDGGTCAPCRGRSCSAERTCCGGETCRAGYCGGCRDRATSCSSSAQCCFSDCTSGACLSALGGTCSRDIDCRSCYLNRTCANACVNGACAV